MAGAKLLYVLRHAKSSWEDEALPDHERPLSGRGRRAVALLAEHVRAQGIDPEVILCSSARRTRETIAGVLPDRDALVEPELYGAGAGALIERLRRVPASTRSVMLVGHNPSAQDLVLTLATSDPAGADGHRAEIGRKFPTGALATLALVHGWAQLAPDGAGLVVAYVTPKLLG